MKQILNLDDITPEAMKSPGGKFVAGFASLGDRLGAKLIGVSLAVVPPGKRAFPKHAHHVNEEMMFILEGQGTYHCGPESAPVRAGDLIAAPPGGAETAHQIENTSDADLSYLTFSTQSDPEIVEYPDSSKFGVVSTLGTGKPVLVFRGNAAETAGYFDGEE